MISVGEYRSGDSGLSIMPLSSSRDLRAAMEFICSKKVNYGPGNMRRRNCARDCTLKSSFQTYWLF